MHLGTDALIASMAEAVDILAGKVAPARARHLSAAVDVRKSGTHRLSQSILPSGFGFSTSAVREWEQGRRHRRSGAPLAYAHRLSAWLGDRPGMPLRLLRLGKPGSPGGPEAGGLAGGFGIALNPGGPLKAAGGGGGGGAGAGVEGAMALGSNLGRRSWRVPGPISTTPLVSIASIRNPSISPPSATTTGRC